jgi:hypothetical protein
VPDVRAGGPVTGFDHHDAGVEALMYRRAVEQALDPSTRAPGGVVHGRGGVTIVGQTVPVTRKILGRITCRVVDHNGEPTGVLVQMDRHGDEWTVGPYSIEPRRAQLEREAFAVELDRQRERADNVRANIADQVAAAYGIPPALLGLVHQ